MKPAPFFSIVLPSFNRAHLLPQAIASVLSQTFNEWELIIVDDGSTDNTAEVVKAIGDERVRYIYQTNAERSAARNNGIAYAEGTYICFLDSDDYYLPQRLNLLYDELTQRNFPVEVFYTDVVKDLDGKVENMNGKYDTEGSVFDNIAEHVIGNPQVCIHKQIFDEFKFNVRFRLGEDMELWLRIARKYKFTYLKNQYTFVAVEHSDRSVNVKRNNTGAEQLGLYKYIFDDAHSGKNISVGVKRYMIAGCYHAIAQYNIHQGNRLPAITAIIRALYTDRKSAWSKFRVNILVKLATFTPLENVKQLIDYE